MSTIESFGWERGFKKVAHSEFFVAEFGYSLSRAKALTDELLEGKFYSIEILNDRSIEEIIEQLKRLGVKIRVIP